MEDDRVKREDAEQDDVQLQPGLKEVSWHLPLPLLPVAFASRTGEPPHRRKKEAHAHAEGGDGVALKKQDLPVVARPEKLQTPAG